MATRTVCVTGGSGLVAGHIIQQLLELGYTVHATVRDPKNEDKVGYLKKLPNAATHLKLFAADLVNEGSFDAAIAGCCGVFHVASPVMATPKDPVKEIYEPAINGTLNVLKACVKAKTVKRVVVTSSVAALFNESAHPESIIIDETYWNNTPKESDIPYAYAKTQAEKAAWKFAEDIKSSENAFDLITILPGVCVGPQLGHDIASSNKLIQYVLGGVFPGNPRVSVSLVDLRDVARAHVLAFENPNAHGRYVIVNTTLWCHEISSILKKEFPDYPIPTGKLPDFVMYLAALFDKNLSWGWLRTHLGKQYFFDSTKARKELGLEFSPIQESINDCARSMIQMGLVQRKKSNFKTWAAAGIVTAIVVSGMYYWLTS